MPLETDVPPHTLAEWRRIWDGAGTAEVAKALSEGRIDGLVDDRGGRFDKRKFAHQWLSEKLETSQNERRWTNLRSWIAIILSAVAIVLHFLKN
jgi:hypothetical protein